MTQGTISWVFGCHSIGHTILVIRAWKKLYQNYPSFKECICIFLHDIGHIGKQYLDDDEQKKQHWQLGASLAEKLFGNWAWWFVAGHDKNSDVQQSKLYKADKYSWYIAPVWWLYWNNVVEPKLKINCKSNMDAIRKFKAAVKQSIESGEYYSTHNLYLDRKYGKEK
jgi:hypothetical protein